MELNRFNQLILNETDEILEEQNQCPTCSSKNYSSIYMEKSTTKAPSSWAIDLNSIGPSRIFFMKCSCGKNWVEKYSENHHRPHIRSTFMKNF